MSNRQKNLIPIAPMESLQILCEEVPEKSSLRYVHILNHLLEFRVISEDSWDLDWGIHGEPIGPQIYFVPNIR